MYRYGTGITSSTGAVKETQWIKYLNLLKWNATLL